MDRNEKVSAMKSLAKYKKYSSVFWGIILLFYGILFYSKFVNNVIPPQTGWWQYMAWRMEQGDLPYKDFYLFIPPYFLLLTSLLFKIFGNHFFLYSILGFLVTRCFMWILIYKMLIKVVKPIYAVIGLVTGLSVTASFLMDSAYDYNPLITFMVVVVAFLFCSLYDQNQNSKIMGLILGIGFFSGLLVLMKQTVGLLIPPVSLISLLWICMQKEYKKRDYIRSLILLVVGIVIGLVPGFVYLLKNDIFNDFYLCMLSAADSKIVDTSMIQLAFRNFIRIDELICALSIILCVMLIRKYSIQKEPVYCLLSVAIVLLALWNEFVNSIKGLKEGIRLGNFLECVALMMILMIALYLIDIQMKKNNVKFALDYILGVLITTFFLLVVFVEHYLTQDIAIILYDDDV